MKRLLFALLLAGCLLGYGVAQPIGGGIVAKSALIVVETASILFTEDGTTPTVAAGTNVGTRMDAGQSYVLTGIKAISSFRCINRVASSEAIVKYRVFY